MAKVKDSPFIYLEQSQGGIFKIPFWGKDGTKTNSIGTADCWNCVCVYIPLDNDFCFVAHIDAWSRTSPSTRDNSDMVPPKGTEESLKNRVKLMLKEEIQRWVPKEGLTEELNSRAIMLNMRPMVSLNGVSTKATGLYIAEAIVEFFGLLGNSEDQHAHGFVVNHATAETEYFRWGDKGRAPTAQDFDRFEDYLRINKEECRESKVEQDTRQYPADVGMLSCDRGKPWCFGYHKGEWYSRAEMISKGYWVRRMAG